ncbi:hypothetical protein ACFSUI_25530 [Ralstonia solanacearum]
MDEVVAVGVVRHNGKIRWFRMDRDNWILDWQKWRDEFIKAGLDVPPLDASGRFGISIVNEDTVEEFIRAASDFELTEGSCDRSCFNGSRMRNLGGTFLIYFLSCLLTSIVRAMALSISAVLRWKDIFQMAGGGVRGFCEKLR